MCQDRKRHKALISGTVPPYVLEVVETYCFRNGMELEVIPEKDGVTDKEYLKEHIDAQTACVVYPASELLRQSGRRRRDRQDRT